MTHEFAAAFQQALGIRHRRTTKESDIDMSCERIDIGECRIADTGGRMTVVQQFSTIFSAPPHELEPLPRDRAQFTGLLIHPGLDRRIPLERTGEPQKAVHANFTSTLHHKLVIPGCRLN